MLEHLGFADCVFVGRQVVAGPNWKVAYDGYLDFYHLPILHKNTFGPDYSNKAIYDAWGPHQRVSSPDHRTLALDGHPRGRLERTTMLTQRGVDDLPPHARSPGSRWPIPTPKAPRRDRVGACTWCRRCSRSDDPDTSVTVQHFLAAFDVPPELGSSR